MLIRLLRRSLRPYAGRLLAVLALQVVQTVAMLFLPTLNAAIIDNGLATGKTGYMIRTGAVMLLVTLVQVAAVTFSNYLAVSATMNIGRDVRADVFHKVQRFSGRDVGHFGTSSLITRTTNDVQQVQTVLLMATTVLVAAPVTLVGGVVMALNQDVPLSGLLLVNVPLLGIITGLVNTRMRSAFGRVQERLDVVNRVLREQIMGVRVVRAFARDDHERERFDTVSTNVLDVALRVGRLTSVLMALTMLVVEASGLAVLWFGGHQVADGGLQVGVLTAFLSYLVQILVAVTMATNMFIVVPRAEVSARRVMEVLDARPSVLPAEVPVTPRTRRGTVELSGVGFGYPGADTSVLRDISLLAEPGTTTAFIGSTGCGKTTVLSLIPRLMDVTAGAILVDGVDVRRLDPGELSAAVGLVPQKLYLFAGTIGGNLRQGAPDATDEELWRALEIAQAREFVESDPAGLDAPVTQGGGNVSGGQRQRLAIARALVHRPRVYLFDDSFSALDPVTEAALRKALAVETADATVIISAQRVSTVSTADRVIVLDEGRVVGSGTHRELVAANATYQEIVRSQRTGLAVAGEGRARRAEAT